MLLMMLTMMLVKMALKRRFFPFQESVHNSVMSFVCCYPEDEIISMIYNGFQWFEYEEVKVTILRLAWAILHDFVDHPSPS